MAAVSREVKAAYAAKSPELHTQHNSRLVKFWWGRDSSIHYEIAAHDRMFQLELGLHFESGANTNQRLLQAFSPHLLEIQHELGDTIWLEEWARGWSRIYETQQLYPLDDERVMSVTARMCEIIDCLQPLLESLTS